jgi:hypothetical protein
MRFACFASVAALVLAAGAASADEMVPNSEFTNWSQFKKGTSVTVKTTSTTSGMTSETVSTSTLVEVGADKVVVEYVSTTLVNGMEVKAPPYKREIPKMVAKVPNPKKDEPKPGEPKEVSVENGTETLKIIGLELKTRWTKNVVEVGGIKTVSKVWYCDEIPGMMVKMDSTLTGSFNSTTKVELVELKKP